MCGLYGNVFRESEQEARYIRTRILIGELVKIEGVIPAMVTPMKEKGEIDYDGLRELTEKLISDAVNGIFVLGSTGEGIKLKRDERKKVVEKACEAANGKVPVFAGTGSITTDESIELTRDAEDAGADFAVINPTYYFKPAPLLKHYARIAESTSLPIVLYNYPELAGYCISEDVVRKASEIDNIVGIKDSSGDMQYFQRLLSIDNFCVIQGFGSLFLPSFILGCRATMAGEANIASEVLVRMHRAFMENRMEDARDMHFRVAEIAEIFEIGAFPANVKHAMSLLGLPAGYARDPCSLTDEEKGEIERILKKGYM